MRLRVVGPDERVGPDAGSLQVVLEDLAVATGHVTEARAELAECAGDTTRADAVLVGILDSLASAHAAIDSLRRAT